MPGSKRNKRSLIKDYNNFHFLNANAPSFEGFYFKAAKKDGTTLVVICGYVRSEERSHAFIQVSTQDADTIYFEYPIDELIIKDGKFKFSINGHSFSENGISIKEENCSINLSFTQFKSWKRTLLNPSIMGALTYFPFVECKHDIVAPSIIVSGEARVGSASIRFNHDSGYIDKNWGRSFPRKYFWGHVAGFQDPSISIQFAKGIPKWFKWKIPVYIGFLRLNEETYRFGSTKSGKMTMINVGQKKLLMTNSKYQIEMKFEEGNSLNLKAPVDGKLNDEILEHAGITTQVKIYRRYVFRSNELIVDETVRNSTVEITSFM